MCAAQIPFSLQRPSGRLSGDGEAKARANGEVCALLGEGSLDGTYETASLILTDSTKLQIETYHESQWNSGFENGPPATPISGLWQQGPPLCCTVEIRCASSPLFLPSSSDLRAFC